MSGSSARTLQNQFLRHFDRTPIQYIRDVRLRGVRDDLLHPDSPDVTVTDVAASWGSKPGPVLVAVSGGVRGVPSETLRRCRS
ncbi:helix-turn-helix domain-containing protein [Rhodococcus hoagii]|nr:helix-turn-helix domain-containing protein [Prescottella equi]